MWLALVLAEEIENKWRKRDTRGEEGRGLGACLPRTAAEPVAHADKKRDDNGRNIDRYLKDRNNVVVVKSHGVVLHQVGAALAGNFEVVGEKVNVEREGRGRLGCNQNSRCVTVI